VSIRIVVADDHTTFANTIVTLLRREGFDVVGVAGDGAEAVRLCLAESPDVALMDINMPGTDGIAATAQLLESRPTWECWCSRCSRTTTRWSPRCRPAHAGTW
jgi:DNA-binding NarL/FixJ family response regulator